MKHTTRKTVIVDGEKLTASVGLLNRISLWAAEYAEKGEAEGYYALAKGAKQASDEIFIQLKSFGVYD